MKAKLLSKRPVSGLYSEEWFDTIGDCDSVLFEDEDYQDWLGVFGRGRIVKFSTAILYTVGSTALVIAGGKGHVIDVNSRELKFRTTCDHLVGAIAVPERHLAIACDFTHLYALTSTEETWKSERAAMDGIRFGHVTPENLSGLAWDLDGWHTFTLRYDT